MNSIKLSSILLLGCIIIFTSCQSSSKIELTVPSIFSDHMVLQQQQEVTIWGKNNPNELVNVEPSWGNEAFAHPDESGNWKLKILTPKAGGPFSIKIITRGKTIELKDVMIGEVWLASGQSNMEMPLEGFLPREPIDNAQEEIANANFPKIRFYTVPRNISQNPINECNSNWKIISPETADSVSATAYFFARKIYQELDVPVGIISSSWGGTPVESWISKNKVIAMNEFQKEMNAFTKADTSSIHSFLSEFQTVNRPDTYEEWNKLNLQDKSFSQPDFDDGLWKKTTLPSIVENWENTTGDDGVYWIRKKIKISDLSTDYVLNITQGIDDMDVTYINGQKIGEALCWNCPRKYFVRKSVLKKGTNTIAIRFMDSGGNGGVAGKMFLQNKNGKNISIEGEWSYMHIADLYNHTGQSKFYLFHSNYSALQNLPAGFSTYKSFFQPNFPSVLYNGMIHPFINYKIKGAIWYQGESNVGRAEQYEKTFPGMIEDWREKWKDDFPFYFVQIAPFSYGNELSQKLRDAQRKSLSTPKTGMAIIMDIGHPTSIHPGNKQDVGDRLARLALVNDYGKKMIASGPLYKSHSISNGKIIVDFDYVGKGLAISGNKLSGFEIAGENKKFIPATAKIVNDKVSVFSKKIKNPKHVRYAWKDFFVGTLFNKEGLPASSFSTE